MNSGEFKKQIAVLPLCLVAEVSEAAETKRRIQRLRVNVDGYHIVKIDRCQYL